MKGGGILLAGATVVVVAAIVAGFVVLGSPSEERARRLDQRRVFDLQQLTIAIDYYVREHRRLPASLDDLASTSAGNVSVRDPISSQPYGYRVVSDTAYELCATFDRESKGEVGFGSQPSAHAAGQKCFNRKAPEQPKQ